ncbi:unnamed protein product [Callosobruchus maculatus]|uniref:Uncharacterized protein n=1 Tax=Callosobruchus maculatus TaxID=64391 RepID=A0A653D0P9_CALMS|nr:unnamed protein product [Callosobruchus maculatus]
MGFGHIAENIAQNQIQHSVIRVKYVIILSVAPATQEMWYCFLHLPPQKIPGNVREIDELHSPQKLAISVHHTIGMRERFGLLATKLALVRILSEFEVVRNMQTPDVVEFDPKSLVLQSKIGLPMKVKKLTQTPV